MRSLPAIVFSLCFCLGSPADAQQNNDFKSPSSWSAYNAGMTDRLSAKGYFGAVFDGRHVYFVPYHSGTSFSGTVLRLRVTGR